MAAVDVNSVSHSCSQLQSLNLGTQAAKLTADIQLEQQRTELIQTQARGRVGIGAWLKPIRYGIWLWVKAWYPPINISMNSIVFVEFRELTMAMKHP